ncbi:copper homeostasis protein CutC [Miniphocaeibacter halophilus]|uniref:Copper homeostasis protein CutC n=1 Tax=Miniphocaeibacter halophilus TaxID=2931922 RepID=A0AC61MQN9_9FIRM|nr:copper homeostasis protein CutC [Miniphocaeibacter halophilus]QQK07896.1 copper homeostasis protein CutC [Miniphocaeibacter halophilus]
MIFELCCGSLEDIVIANELKVDRIELNAGLALGGLTPSLGLLELAIKETNIPLALMVRPRGGGFMYNDYDYKTMLKDLQIFLQYNIEGIVFGFLDKDFNIDIKKTEEFINIIKKSGKKAIYHRAFDNTSNKTKSIEELISLGCDRLLTSGGKNTAIDGKDMIKSLQKEYGNKIDIVAGSGLKSNNIKDFINYTNVTEIHSSCKEWKVDNTSNSFVSYDYNLSYKGMYDGVSRNEVIKMKEALKNL